VASGESEGDPLSPPRSGFGPSAVPLQYAEICALAAPQSAQLAQSITCPSPVWNEHATPSPLVHAA
jgi:hypothetical protein